MLRTVFRAMEKMISPARTRRDGGKMPILNAEYAHEKDIKKRDPWASF